MLFIFRKLRRSFFQPGKVRTYVAYAVGEIVLIVVGILIALQISNWNQVIQEQRELRGYLLNISRNIQADLDHLSEVEGFRKSSAKAHGILMATLEKEVLELADLQSVNQSAQDVFWDRYFDADTSGFEALKSSGYLGKLQGTKMESLLYEYYRTVEAIRREEESLNNFVENMEVEVFLSTESQASMKHFQSVYAGKSPVDQNVIRPFFNLPAFQGAFARAGASPVSLIPFYVQLRETGGQILEESTTFYTLD